MSDDPPDPATGEERAFWAAIAATPAEDTPPLAYADWLDEHGDPARAELIRLQCGLDRGRDWATGTIPPTAGGWPNCSRGRRNSSAPCTVMAIRPCGRPPRELVQRGLPGFVTFRRGMIDRLDLAQTDLVAYPHGLPVFGSIDLCETDVTEVPAGLRVNCSLYLSNNKLA